MTFLKKVKTAQTVVSRLCLANVFPVETDQQLADAIVLLGPCLTQMSRDEFCEVNRWLSEDTIRKLHNVRHSPQLDECNEITSRQRNLMKNDSCSGISAGLSGKQTNAKRARSNTLTGSTVAKASKKTCLCGMLSVQPTRQQQHLTASSVQLSSHLEDWAPTNDGKTELTCENTNGLKCPNNNNSLIFNKLKDGSDRLLLPVIVVETHRDEKTNKSVKGPVGQQGDLLCFLNDQKNRLSMVLSCPTTSVCTHCFSMAHTRPHFVILEQDMPSHSSQVVTAQSGMSKLLIHLRHCLLSPINVNNDDGSLNFRLHSCRTKEFRENFGSIDTDFSWWMKQFYSLKKHKVDD